MQSRNDECGLSKHRASGERRPLFCRAAARQQHKSTADYFHDTFISLVIVFITTNNSYIYTHMYCAFCTLWSTFGFICKAETTMPFSSSATVGVNNAKFRSSYFLLAYFSDIFIFARNEWQKYHKDMHADHNLNGL